MKQHDVRVPAATQFVHLSPSVPSHLLFIFLHLSQALCKCARMPASLSEWEKEKRRVVAYLWYLSGEPLWMDLILCRRRLRAAVSAVVACQCRVGAGCLAVVAAVGDGS